MQLLTFIVTASLIAAGVLFCFKKWGWLSAYNVHRKKWMPAADCFFCISFWFSLPFTSKYVANFLGYHRTDWLPEFSDLEIHLYSIPLSLAIATLSAFICTVIIEPEQV